MTDSFRERVRGEMVHAMKASDRVRAAALRLILDALQQEELSLKKTSLTDEEALRVLEREAKRRREAAEAFEKGGRSELAENERAELAIISTYLPEQMSDTELEKIVRDAVAAEGAGASATGAVMKAVMAQVRGKADGTRVKAVVSRILSVPS